MKNQYKFIDKLQEVILENAAQLKLETVKISDRARLDASLLPAKSVKALYKSKKYKIGQKCRYFEMMPYKPIPNAVMYKIDGGSYN